MTQPATQPAAPSIGLNDRVSFDDGRGNELTGIVFRPLWGRKLDHVSIKTEEDKPRTFVRLLPQVKLAAKARRLNEILDCPCDAFCDDDLDCPQWGSRHAHGPCPLHPHTPTV